MFTQTNVLKTLLTPHIGNLKHPVGVSMIKLHFDSDNSPIPPLF